MKRVYVDTSVFGGVFDEEFQKASQGFFDQIRGGQFNLVTSAVVEQEIIPLYNAVNILNRYDQIAIFSPLEVMKYED